MSKTTKILLYSIVAVIFISACVVFSIFDLDISNAIVNQSSPFGLFMEVPGMLVAPYIFITAGIIIAIYSLKDKSTKYYKLYTFAGVLFSFVGICYCGTIYAKFKLFICILLFILTFALAALLVYILNKRTKDEIYFYFKVSVTAIIYLLSVLIIVSVIKLFWGRVRFREMTDIAQFTKWFIPQGITGNNSFPSGHTANATTLYVITLLVPKMKSKITKALLYIVPVMWTVTMAISRVIIGAHYASDVLFGAAVSILLFYLCKKFIFNKLKQSEEK